MLPRSLTAEHQLQDAEDELALAIYCFREAERLMSSDYDAARCAMNRAEWKVATIRQHIYSGNSHKLFENLTSPKQLDGCPIPAWI